MISTKFVNIARNVIVYVKNGGQLNYRFLCKDNYCCPLGAVCINAGFDDHKNNKTTVSYPVWHSKWYDYAYTQSGFGPTFFIGFDEHRFSHLSDVELESYPEDYIIGYKLAQFCKKRNWLSVNHDNL
jgi:hypothetical protein